MLNSINRVFLVCFKPKKLSLASCKHKRIPNEHGASAVGFSSTTATLGHEHDLREQRPAFAHSGGQRERNERGGGRSLDDDLRATTAFERRAVVERHVSPRSK